MIWILYFYLSKYLLQLISIPTRVIAYIHYAQRKETYILYTYFSQLIIAGVVPQEIFTERCPKLICRKKGHWFFFTNLPIKPQTLKMSTYFLWWWWWDITLTTSSRDGSGHYHVYMHKQLIRINLIPILIMSCEYFEHHNPIKWNIIYLIL